MKRQQPSFERGAVVISIDTEQIWGHFDISREREFRERYPDAPRLRKRSAAAVHLLGGPERHLGRSGRTRFQVPVVPVIRECAVYRKHGSGAFRRAMRKRELSWYRRRFVAAIRDVAPTQEIALHGGLTHKGFGEMGITFRESPPSRNVAWHEALGEIGVLPLIRIPTRSRRAP